MPSISALPIFKIMRIRYVHAWRTRSCFFKWTGFSVRKWEIYGKLNHFNIKQRICFYCYYYCFLLPTHIHYKSNINIGLGSICLLDSLTLHDWRNLMFFISSLRTKNITRKEAFNVIMRWWFVHIRLLSFKKVNAVTL